MGTSNGKKQRGKNMTYKKVTRYECPICNTHYATKEEAQKCLSNCLTDAMVETHEMFICKCGLFYHFRVDVEVCCDGEEEQ